MWTVIYIAINRIQADKMKELLCTEGILANTRAIGASATNSDGAYEILVLESEARDANEIICQHVVMKKIVKN